MPVESVEPVEALITEACELLEDPRLDVSTAFTQMATLRVELLEAAARCDDPELIDDCCGTAAQLEERLAEIELEPVMLATPA